MSNWSSFCGQLSDGTFMDALISGPAPLLPLPTVQARTPAAPSLPPLSPLFPTARSSYSFPFLVPDTSTTPISQAPFLGPAGGVFGLSSFASLGYSTSSHLLAGRDGHTSVTSLRHSGLEFHVPTVGRTTDNNFTLTSPLPQSARQQVRLNLPTPSANFYSARSQQYSTTIFNDNQQNHLRQPRPRLSPPGPNSDEILRLLATSDLSSPSLPPYCPQIPPQQQLDRDFLFNNTGSVSTSRPWHLPALSTRLPPAHWIPHLERQSAGLTQIGLEEQGDREHKEDEKITVDSLLPEMPTTTTSRKRSRAVASVNLDEPFDGPSTSKRSRVSGSHATIARSRATIARPTSSRGRQSRQEPARLITLSDDEVDSLFGGGGDDDEVRVFDLTRTDDVPEELLKPKEDNSVKLSNFECIICMDTASHLTVTHCGHMFCAQCLHQAMHTEVTKKVCPMCRQKLDVRPKTGQPTKNAKTFFHLEFKLMPSKRQGKQPARR